jgi:hypothetical protein
MTNSTKRRHVFGQFSCPREGHRRCCDRLLASRQIVFVSVRELGTTPAESNSLPALIPLVIVGCCCLPCVAISPS